jgi:hypothetical protein
MEDEKEKSQEQIEKKDQSESLSEADADRIFNEATGEAAPEDGSGAQGTPETGAAQEEKQTLTEEKQSIGDQEESREESSEILKKRLQDTQKWGHEVSQELAKLKKELEDFKTTVAAEAKKKEIEIVPENVKTFYEDYPDFADAVQYEAKKLLSNTLGDVDIKQVSGMVQQAEAQREFERRVMYGSVDGEGNLIDGHPDAYRVMISPDFKAWVDDQAKTNPNLLDVDDPVKAIGIISRFKEHVAQTAAKKHDEQNRNAATKVREFLSGAVPMGTSGTTGGKSRSMDDEDPEKIFNKAAGIKG